MVESSHSQLRKKNSWPGQAYNFIKRENLVQVFFSEFSEISNNTFFYRTPPVAVSVVRRNTNHKKDESKRIERKEM